MAATTRAERVAATRAAILTAAERLFAEHGIAAVSNRQIGEAAGQGNNTVVGYHFGTKNDLVRAIAREHVGRIDERRAELLAATGDSDELRDWVECLVLPTTDHLDSLGSPSWFARFSARAFAEPELRAIVEDESFGGDRSLRQVAAGVDRCLSALPSDVRAERDAMVRWLTVVVPARREGALAAGRPVHRDSWRAAGIGLVDAIVGLYSAPVTPV